MYGHSIPLINLLFSPFRLFKNKMNQTKNEWKSLNWLFVKKKKYSFRCINHVVTKWIVLCSQKNLLNYFVEIMNVQRRLIDFNNYHILISTSDK